MRSIDANLRNADRQIEMNKEMLFLFGESKITQLKLLLHAGLMSKRRKSSRLEAIRGIKR